MSNRHPKSQHQMVHQKSRYVPHSLLDPKDRTNDIVCMRASFKLILRTDHKDKQSQVPIFLRMISHYKTKHFYTGRKVAERQWNKDRQQVRSSHPDAVEMNQYLEDFVRIKRDQFRQSGFLIDGVSKSTVAGDVVAFIDKIAKRPGQSFRTEQKYVTLKSKLVEFSGTTKIPFDKLTPAYVREFDSFMQLSQQLRVNTRIKYLDMLRGALTCAAEQGVITASSFPKLRMRKEESEKRRLSIDELRKLQEYSAPSGSRKELARDMFLLSVFIGGSRWEDTVLLEWNHIKNGSIHFTMQKTGKRYEVIIISQAKAIIDRYAHRSGECKFVFPFMENVSKEDFVHWKKFINVKNSQINNQLRLIAKDLDIEPFTFHCARHTAADLLRVRGVSLYDVQHILRHSSLRMTAIYLKELDNDSANAAFAKAMEAI